MQGHIIYVCAPNRDWYETGGKENNFATLHVLLHQSGEYRRFVHSLVVWLMFFVD